ncbi:hypothetical protein Ocepr_2299 (plasmid) [Oceanithermus profundus DSM 14977]|uniref:Uncharacterized protein n=1 Tax=Oceanithermus profundus (strain DSM 14977 / NBRC 100410 / VKM B-2274 / 506) TaxID=670487 RepID=E4UAW2_OCEP5|nr:hypothetical protein [Oceanithermus profundus]ADR37747.1 hypothetical protein Ocepr_2299 [Oceanithermus profundus DSM 14977]
MKRNERLYGDLSPRELLDEGAEPVLLVRPGEGQAPYRVPLYSGEDLDAAVARARSAVPDAEAIELQVYLRGRFHYVRL